MKPALPRTLGQIADDLIGVRKLSRLEKKELGGVTPRTANRARMLLAEADSVCVIHDAKHGVEFFEPPPDANKQLLAYQRAMQKGKP